MSNIEQTIETELKFKVTGVRVKSVNPSEIIGGSPTYLKGTGLDTFYYSKATEDKEFYRFRHNSDGQELSIKVKINGSNKDRIEETFKLSDENTASNTDLFMSAMKLTKGNTLRKDYEVWFGRDGILSYYKVYRSDNNMFLGTYIEIEAYSEDDAFTRARALKKMKENLYNTTGLTDKNLETKSIFELYGRTK